MEANKTFKQGKYFKITKKGETKKTIIDHKHLTEKP